MGRGREVREMAAGLDWTGKVPRKRVGPQRRGVADPTQKDLGG